MQTELKVDIVDNDNCYATITTQEVTTGSATGIELSQSEYAQLSLHFVMHRELHFEMVLEALRDLADLQNGAPLVRYEKEWNEVMEKVYSILELHGA